ncbi:5-nucleotidase SurE [Pseudonocardia sp. Ae168_Ps1]|uniref:5'/3'-nucleotidase SurE n=1 Tax=unclassified Pseudonocardia TaxID=2619320 RepID=UPI00094AD19E|nr:MULTISPECIES: 5'/3'-nucleotidase SurE [unclassified Pseudonocardia]OLL74728.1 5-nucleotidase SurE [Pseudonocardia sp. Ae150A_Ps1]OLL80710.1 5-nucleotidase SurE [Pseudonocardia sp. Ae168_Ps1]OLL85163.1 5-nucleotidase SurE [Pseudonocardia sp. Ae263_Ps1]OLL94812.1 5-nucleotidase SurE [Pseudonocardia sp. Ae356_Ps1]OLM21195.1 5-nucleotidase SurE [Pseudonocardia sp. Ae707_Ps1]
MPLALITNDDGIDSPGLYALARGARDAGYDVVVAAPAADASGAGGSVRSVTDDGHTAVHARDDIGELDGIEAWAVAADPAYIVHAAGQGWFAREPDVVLSGINVGANTGAQVLHSGTVGAVLTGALHGWSGIALSLACGLSTPAEPNWATVTGLLPELLERLRSRPAGTPWTVNVPDVPAAGLPPLREAALCATGAVRVRVAHRAPERGPDGVRPGGLRTFVSEDHSEALPGTDVALLAAGHPTVTELAPIGSRAGGTGYPA